MARAPWRGANFEDRAAGEVGSFGPVSYTHLDVYKRQAQGRKVALARGVKELPRAGTVLASCVFSTAPSAMRVEILRRCYGATVQVGGSGVDLRLRLAPDIEAMAPDYSLYPEMGDRALGFLTRGCPRRCPFRCV